MAYQTTPFSIAHYILLICMVVLCGGIVAYAIIHDAGQHDDVLPTPVVASAGQQPQSAPVPTTPADPACVQTVTDAVARMWAYNPEVVPVKYKDIAMAYYTGPVNATIRGECNGVRFVCRPGVQRANCDPCASGSARDFAISVQTRDMIQKHCIK